MIQENIQRAPKRKRREKAPVAWIEPRRRGGPDLNAREVSKILQFSVQRVNELAKIGPERNGLPAYINLGDGWQRKTGPHTGVEMFFYRSDVEEWEKKHPLLPKETREEKPSYTEQEKALVLAEAAKIADPKTGAVSRTQLFARLRFQPETIIRGKGGLTGEPRQEEGLGSAIWQESRWAVMRAILDDAGIPSEKSGRRAGAKRQYKTVLKWYVIENGNILMEADSYLAARRRVLAKCNDNRKRPTIKRANHGLYHYISPGKKSYWISNDPNFK